MACWRDHSAGASRRRAMPMPRGNRPSMAAFTSVGERKASEIVMLTCRTLHFSRAASRSTSETLRLEWCGQEGHYETQQRDHGTQLGHGLCRGVMPVSYTHLTLPTNREV